MGDGIHGAIDEQRLKEQLARAGECGVHHGYYPLEAGGQGGGQSRRQRRQRERMQAGGVGEGRAFDDGVPREIRLKSLYIISVPQPDDYAVLSYDYWMIPTCKLTIMRF